MKIAAPRSTEMRMIPSSPAFSPEVFRDGSADFGDTIVNLLFGEQNLANVLMHVQSFDSIRQARLPSLL